jgi:glycerophosphoryl diester phosphodiesterase
MGVTWTDDAWEGTSRAQERRRAGRSTLPTGKEPRSIVPENTREGFREGLRVSAGVLELDVHTTADGTVVVIHDETVDLTTDGSGAICEMTRGEIKRLDAKYWFLPTAAGHILTGEKG